MNEEIYAEPRKVDKIEDCYFYHTMDIPGYGTVMGEWDLRGREDVYLGGVGFHGRTVLELGTASGHLCFYMEKQGAAVTAFDLSAKHDWDIVPYAGHDYTQHILDRRKHIDRINNGYWYAHRAYASHAKMVYGTVYAIPDEIGSVDICTLGSILLHLRDPFLALQRAAAHTRSTIIITEMPVKADGKPGKSSGDSRIIHFLPDAAACEPWETWWSLTPGLIIEFIRILGFEDIKLTYHKQRFFEKPLELYTIVGRRTIPL